MIPWGLAQTVADAHEMAWAAAARLFGVLSQQTMGPTDQTQDVSQDDEVERIRTVLWQLRRGYESLAGDGTLKELVQQVELLYQSGRESRQTILLWVRLVESLVHDAEARLGSKKGLGPIKAHEVKGILLHLFLEGDQPVSFPLVPPFVAPIAVEAAVTLSIDSIVLILNRHRLLDAASPSPERASFWRRLVLRIQVLLEPLLSLFETLSRRFILWQYPLLPSSKEIVLKARVHYQQDVRRISSAVSESVGWAIDHRRQLTQLVVLVGIAVEQAETFLHKKGPEKKQFAKDLILAFLLNEGFLESRQGLMYSIVSAFLDVAIDTVVDLYNRNHVFN